MMRTGSFWLQRPEQQAATTPSTKLPSGDAHAELIMRLVAGQIAGPMPRHAQLYSRPPKAGLDVLNPDSHGRIVRLAGRTFGEGHLESLVAEASAWEALGEGRPLGTKRQRQN